MSTPRRYPSSPMNRIFEVPPVVKGVASMITSTIHSNNYRDKLSTSG